MHHPIIGHLHTSGAVCLWTVYQSGQVRLWDSNKKDPNYNGPNTAKISHSHSMAILDLEEAFLPVVTQEAQLWEQPPP